MLSVFNITRPHHHRSLSITGQAAMTDAASVANAVLVTVYMGTENSSADTRARAAGCVGHCQHACVEFDDKHNNEHN